MKQDLKIVDQIAAAHLDYLQFLSSREQERMTAVRILYVQQLEMFNTNTRRTDNRIVSLSQPWVRPTKRGKQNAETEFGAKLEMSDVNGFLRIEHMSWDAFNESTTLQESVENYRRAYGHYPKRVLADTIFRTSENPRYCKKMAFISTVQNLVDEHVIRNCVNKSFAKNGLSLVNAEI